MKRLKDFAEKENSKGNQMNTSKFKIISGVKNPLGGHNSRLGKVEESINKNYANCSTEKKMNE